MKVIMYLLAFFIVNQGCRPAQQETEFTALINAPLGEDLNLQTKEEQDVQFEYSVSESEQSINLEIIVTKNPAHGTLKNCKKLSSAKINCTYSPEKDFFGKDTIEVIAKDGDVKSSKSSTIRIDVINIPDAPVALDAYFAIGSNQELNFILPAGEDSDSSIGELIYEIVDGPENGELINCTARKCKYVSNSLYEGVDTITYKIKDNTGLISELAKIEITVNLLGFWASETFHSDTDQLTGVDIIWVIDNSLSMAGEQASLATNFNYFIDNFIVGGKVKFDFNMAVTTTDAYLKTSGNPFAVDSFGNQFDFSSSAAETDCIEFKERFAQAVNVGTTGAQKEKSLQSIDKALSLMPSWYGNNSRLLTFIILTDENEQSSDSVLNYYNKFSLLKDSARKVQYYPVINFDKDSGNRYKELSNLSGTQFYDINSSFQTILDDIGLNVSSDMKSFPLNPSVNIISTSIQVKLNGTEPLEFSYDKNRKRVMVSNIPPGNNTIVVTYQYGVQ